MPIAASFMASIDKLTGVFSVCGVFVGSFSDSTAEPLLELDLKDVVYMVAFPWIVFTLLRSLYAWANRLLSIDLSLIHI